jgi:Lrp/AsnC family transcriptional regulator, leucine-responsive regulatory protein
MAAETARVNADHDGSRRIDGIDREILRRLAANGRLSYAKLGQAVSLSPNAAAERVRRLVRDGVISGVHAAIDAAAIGRPLQALIDLRLLPTTTPDEFERAAAALDGVEEVTFLTGRFDFQLRAACRDSADLDRLLRELRSSSGVAETESRLVLRDILRRGVRID